jgi:hypothetical protein
MENKVHGGPSGFGNVLHSTYKHIVSKNDGKQVIPSDFNSNENPPQIIRRMKQTKNPKKKSRKTVLLSRKKRQPKKSIAKNKTKIPLLAGNNRKRNKNEPTDSVSSTQKNKLPDIF